MTGIIPVDTIQAYQIENGDQILVDGDPLESVTVSEDYDDPSAVIVSGFSNESGDKETYTLPYDYEVQVWSV